MRPQSNMINILEQKKNGGIGDRYSTKTHTHTQNAIWIRGKNLGDVSTSEGITKIVSNAQGERWNTLFFTVLRRNHLC